MGYPFSILEMVSEHLYVNLLLLKKLFKLISKVLSFIVPHLK